MGRRNNDIIIGHGTKLDEKYLLEYALSCPCCRQQFLKEELLEKGTVTEEKREIDQVRMKLTRRVTPLMEEDEEQECPV